jgi:hypothetical protein
MATGIVQEDALKNTPKKGDKVSKGVISNAYANESSI